MIDTKLSAAELDAQIAKAEKKGGWGKWLVVFVIVVGGLLLMWTTSTFAQERTGVRLADAAQPTTSLMQAAEACMEKMASFGLKPKDAGNFCLKAFELEVKRGDNAGGHADEATEALKPTIVQSPYGYGGYVPYGGGVNTTFDPYASHVNPYGSTSYGGGVNTNVDAHVNPYGSTMKRSR